MSFEEYYKNVPSYQREMLRLFRVTHPRQQTTINETCWTYIYAGEGEKTVLWLTGGLRVADMAFQSILKLEAHYRVVAPDYPALESMNDLVDGLAALLDQLGVETTAIISDWFGGMVAQVFVRRYPHRVSKIILTNVPPPEPKRIDFYRTRYNMLRWLPDFWVLQLIKSIFFKITSPYAEMAEFYAAFFDELFAERLHKEDILSMLRCVEEYCTYQFTPTDLDHWEGSILITNDESNAIFNLSNHKHMQFLYPNAQTFSFKSSSYTSLEHRQEAFYQQVRTFFE